METFVLCNVVFRFEKVKSKLNGDNFLEHSSSQEGVGIQCCGCGRLMPIYFN